MPPTFLTGDLPFSSLSRNRSLRDQVSEQLRAAVISGVMRPGVLYSAPSLAEMLGVSATPVREAMQSLVREGLVEVAHNKGFKVKDVSAEELDELVETRLLLEVPLMGEVAAGMSPEKHSALEELRELTRRLEDAAAEDDLVTYIAADTEFHLSFLELHGNAVAVNTVQSLRHKSRLYGLERLARSGELLGHTYEHAEMVDLAQQGKAEELKNLVRRHIGHVRTDWAADDPR